MSEDRTAEQIHAEWERRRQRRAARQFYPEWVREWQRRAEQNLTDWEREDRRAELQLRIECEREGQLLDGWRRQDIREEQLLDEWKRQHDLAEHLFAEWEQQCLHVQRLRAMLAAPASAYIEGA